MICFSFFPLNELNTENASRNIWFYCHFSSSIDFNNFTSFIFQRRELKHPVLCLFSWYWVVSWILREQLLFAVNLQMFRPPPNWQVKNILQLLRSPISKERFNLSDLSIYSIWTWIWPHVHFSFLFSCFLCISVLQQLKEKEFDEIKWNLLWLK